MRAQNEMSTLLHHRTSIRVTETPAGMSKIHRPECAAVIWHREPMPSFQSWIDGLSPAHLPRVRMTLSPERVHDAVMHICDLCGTPNCAERALFTDDVSAMADIFAELVDAPYLMLRLDVVTTNACCKFHVDAVPVRLICTYRGTGTQYGIASGDAEPCKIETVPTGAPILLRGTNWPEHPRSGLRHRSPPIEAAGETRLVMVLDPITDMDEGSDGNFLH